MYTKVSQSHCQARAQTAMVKMGPRETALRETVEDLRDWLMDMPNWAAVARLGGLSRMTFYNLQNPKWNISVGVMYGVARARDKLEKQQAEEEKKKKKRKEKVLSNE